MTYPLTIISGYWRITNKYGNSYENDWFKNTLRINAPYIFFGPADIIQYVKQFRKHLPTCYIECNITDFYTYKYYNTIQTHPVHCPSVELNLIWNEKTFLIQKAAKLNPFQSEYFAWVDAGMCTYRTSSPPIYPFPNIEKLNKLPKNKFIFTTAVEDLTHSEYNFKPKDTYIGNYYHYLTGTFMLHKSIIDKWASLFKEYIDKLLILNDWKYTDQVIYTLIYKDHPDMFYKLGDGYGMIVPLLY